MTSFQIPKHYLPKLVMIMQSGCLDLKNEKAILHFDKDNTLRIVEFPKKFMNNLTE